MLLCHCPPRGINDDPDDPAHVGFEGLRTGSTTTSRATSSTATRTRSPGSRRRSYGDTRVHWISGARVVVLD